MSIRATLPSVLLAIPLVACAPDPGPDLSPRPLNVVVLNIELLRADHVGLISREAAWTPHIDRFFAGGVVFADATAPAGATYLSATAIATGTEAMLNDHRLTGLGVGINEAVARDGRRVVDRLPTIAETLDGHGYRTVALNEWQHTGRRVHLDRGFDEFIQVTAPPRALATTEEGITLFAEQIDMLLDLLERNRGERFYLYFHPNSLHSPFRLPVERASRDPALFAELQALGTVRHGFVGVHALQTSPDAVEEERRRALVRRMYVEQVRYVDEELGRLFDALERDDLLDRTVVLLYSNHGTGLFDNDVAHQGVSYQSCQHVPLLIRHPGVRAAIRVETPVSLVDLAATLYELLGVESRLPLPAHSLLPPMQGLPYGREFLLGRNVQSEFIRRGDWKLIVNSAQTRELYDVRADPRETRDLHDPELEIVRTLESELKRQKIRQHALRVELSRRFNVPLGWPDEASAPGAPARGS